MGGKDTVKRPNLGDSEHQQQKRHRKNENNARSRGASLALKKRLQESLSPVTVEEDDIYTFSEESAKSWAGTLHEESSKHHKEIDRAARLPHTNLKLNQEILRLLHRDKFEAFEELAAFDFKPAEIRIPGTSSGRSLAELKKADLRPILLTNIGLNVREDLKGFVNKLHDYSGVTIDVYDPSLGTRRTTVRELDEVLVFKKHTAAPFNFLDIENRTGVQYTPQPIVQASLELKCRIKLQQQHNGHMGKNLVVNSMQVPSEFFICSQQGAISQWHVDAGGWCTWAMMLQGCKWWYFPTGDRDVILKDHEAGETLEGDEQIKLKLEPGAALVQYPGQIHAVWTRSDSLMIGGHFYTAPTFAASLDTIRMRLENKLRDNEDMPLSLWHTLTTIIKCLDDRSIFSEKHAEHTLDGLQRLISSPAWMTHISHISRGDIISENLALETGQKKAAKATNQEKAKRSRKTTKTAEQGTSSPPLDPRQNFHIVADALVKNRRGIS